MAKKERNSNPEIELIQSVKIPITLVDNNIGQIPGVRENPREMTDQEYKKLKKSLKRDPDYTAISELRLYPFQGRYVTIGGNMRLHAMKEIGWTEVIAKVLPEDTPIETLNRWILLDNANYGKWDFEKLANQWEEDLLADMNIDIPAMADPEDEEEAKDDNCDVEALKPDIPRSRLGDIYLLGAHRLIVGDSTKNRYLEALMEDEVADLLATDPPYNVDYVNKNRNIGNHRSEGNIANDVLDNGVFLEFLETVFKNCDRYLKPGGAFYIWHAAMQSMNFITSVSATGWKWVQTLIWNKNSLVLGRQDYQWKHEPCLYGWKGGAAHYFAPRRDLTTVIEQKPDLEAMTKDELKQMLSKIFSLPSTVIDENKPLRNAEHPTMKPVPLIGRQIKNSSRRGEIVLDVFGGSGSTLIAAEQLGRKCRMVECDPVYADVIVKRWEELTGEEARYIRNIDDEAEKEAQNAISTKTKA